jgi:benzoylformate decarboxylase
LSTVRSATFDLLRRSGMTTIFGNPGSNELPFLAGMPDDFTYVLGLHEGAVMGMADGYAMASGRPAFVNLHAAAGTGNAMGALTNAMTAHTPLVVSAGQQVRSTLGLEPLLANTEAAQLPKPLVKWSVEPASAVDVPRAFSQAVHTARLEPQGPVYISIPYDDWAVEADVASDHLGARTVVQAGSPSEEQVAELVGVLAGARNPVLVVGPAVDAAGANGLAVELAERLRMPAWIAPSLNRCPFPTRHPSFRGVLPAAVQGIARLLADHDLIVVVGAPVFRYHQYDPGDYLPAGAELVHLTSDPAEATRAPMGRSVVGDLTALLGAVLKQLPVADRPMPEARPVPALPAEREGGLWPEQLFTVVDEATPDDVIYVKESTSTTAVFMDHVDLREQGSFYFPAAGGLGFGMPAAVGVAMARPERRVVGLIGDGSAHYGITALWTAAAYRVPVTFVILKNGTYGALKAFAGYMGVAGVPGLDISGVDYCAIAEGYGVPARRAGTADELRTAMTEAMASDGPVLIEVPTLSTNPFE